MKVKVYSFQDEMIVKEEVNICFAFSYKDVNINKITDFLLIKDDKSPYGYSLLRLHNENEKTYIKEEITPLKASYIINSFISKLTEIKADLNEYKRVTEIYYEFLASE